MKRIISSFTVIMVIFSAGYLFAGQNWSLNDETQQSTKSFKVTKGGTLKISLVFGDVRINTWDKNEVNVKMEDMDDIEAMNAHQVKIIQEGNTIIVENKGGGGWPNSNDVSVSVPKEFNLDIKTNQGDVDLRSFIKGSVDIKTGGGDINVKDIDGKVELKTNGGDIDAGNLTGNVNISTNGGDLSAGNIEGSADFSSMGGSITLGNVSKDLEVKTNGGEIYAGNIGGKIIAITMGGEIVLKKVQRSADIKTNGGNIKLTGSGGPVNAKTMGGNIELYNISGPVDAKTNAGNVYVKLKSVGNSASTISTMAGDISLYIEPSENVTIKASARGGNYNWENKAIISDFTSKDYESGKYSGFTKATYVLNSGNQTISLKTMSGRIIIKKLKK